MRCCPALTCSSDGVGCQIRSLGLRSGSRRRDSRPAVRRVSSSEDPRARVGHLGVSSRYHKLPARIEQDYDIQDTVLGQGYSGVVRMAIASGSPDGKQRFAVKAFKLQGIDGDKRTQLHSEVSVFLGLDHPHIARLVDVYETDEILHLVMECLDGGELFERVTRRKRYSEQDAAEATQQMLLAVNYMHSQGMVHRDLKLENFLYDGTGQDNLKLIDFGFSKVWDPNIKMHVSCGTLSYVAPEVLEKCYTSQCDLWSLGVIAFILLAGYMPFSGSEEKQKSSILAGRFTLKPERWGTISPDGVNFVKALLQVSPTRRWTADKALKHAWIVRRSKRADVEIDDSIVQGLRQFGQASKFRRCCMGLMAWSLSNDDRAMVRQYFVSMDKNRQGTITLAELRTILTQKFSISDRETQQVFEALDTNCDETIHYSDFLAAMLNTRIAMHDRLLRSAFRRFDTDSSGYITTEDLRQVLGDTFEGVGVEKLLSEADLLRDNRISYEEFVAYLRGTPLEAHREGAGALIDDEILRKRGDAALNHDNSCDKFWSPSTLVQHGSPMPRSFAALRGLKQPTILAAFRSMTSPSASSNGRCCHVM